MYIKFNSDQEQQLKSGKAFIVFICPDCRNLNTYYIGEPNSLECENCHPDIRGE